MCQVSSTFKIQFGTTDTKRVRFEGQNCFSDGEDIHIMMMEEREKRWIEMLIKIQGQCSLSCNCSLSTRPLYTHQNEMDEILCSRLCCFVLGSTVGPSSHSHTQACIYSAETLHWQTTKYLLSSLFCTETYLALTSASSVSKSSPVRSCCLTHNYTCNSEATITALFGTLYINVFPLISKVFSKVKIQVSGYPLDFFVFFGLVTAWMSLFFLLFLFINPSVVFSLFSLSFLLPPVCLVRLILYKCFFILCHIVIFNARVSLFLSPLLAPALRTATLTLI